MTVSGDAIAAKVKSFIGDRYVYGGAGPNVFDCSGLVQYTLKSLGVNNVPRTSEEQYAWAHKISRDQLEPGDLVFAQFAGDNASPGHVGIYTGNGQVLSAQDPALGIGYASLASWGSHVVGYGRVPSATAGTDAQTTGLTSGIFSWPGEITSFFSDANSFVTKMLWIVEPGSWLRIGAFFAGVILLAFAIYSLASSSSGGSMIPQVVPVPV